MLSLPGKRKKESKKERKKVRMKEKKETKKGNQLMIIYR